MSIRALLTSTAALAALIGTAAAQEAPADGATIPRPAPGANQVAVAAPAETPDTPFDVQVSGYVRVQEQQIFEDADEGLPFGRNDGFTLDSARLIIEANKGPLAGYISLDGAVDRFDGKNSTLGTVNVGLKDAWIGYGREDFPFVKLMVGQFKPPFDAEEQRSTRDMLFIDRAVASRGVRAGEGWNLDGLSIDRDIGGLVYGEPTFGDFGLAYYFALTNGGGANRVGNDNDAFQYTGRVELRYGNMLTLGVAANLNDVTTGDELEDFVDERYSGLAADLSGRFPLGPVGLILQAQFIQQSASFPDVPVEPDRVALGYHGALGVELPMGFTVAYRYAFLDPTSSFETDDETAEATLDTDAVTLHTVGLNWQGEAMVPLKAQINYTLSQEQEPKEIANDRLDLLFQVAF